MTAAPPIRPRILARPLAAMAALVLLAKLGPASLGLPVAAALAAWALLGNRQAVEALILVALLIVVGGLDLSLGRWLVLFAAGLRIVLPALPAGDVPRLVWPLALFGAVVLLLSLLVSAAPLVSLLKLTAFLMGVATLAVGFHRTSRSDPQLWLSWLYTLALLILFGSVPMYFTSLGYSRNGVGFQGFLTHPQTFGPVLAPLTALLMGLYLFGDRRSPLVTWGVVLGWAGMFFSQARTAVFATLLGLSVVLVTALVGRRAWRAGLRRAASRRAVQIGTVAVALLAWAQQTSAADHLREFLVKRAGDATVMESLQMSRGRLALTSFQNFLEAPVAGIGFGVASDPRVSRAAAAEGPLGLPVQASVEKGFMPTAVLEETGLVGAVLVLVLVASLLAPTYRYRDPTLLWVVATALMVNLGEMVFFSFGGMGFYLWIVMLACYQHGRLAPAPAPAGPRPSPVRRA